MQFEGAVIRQQNVKFAVVIVKKHILDNRIEANKAIRSFSGIFPAMPVVLMAQDIRGRASYYGRSDISHFLARVPINAIPWKRYTLN
jgi:hypothetical protein